MEIIQEAESGIFVYQTLGQFITCNSFFET